MVLTGLPERVEPAHPVPADQDVLQGVVEGMAHVQHARDVGRRDHDAEGFTARRIGAGPERTGFVPCVIQTLLGLGGVEILVQCHLHLSHD